MCVCTGGGGGKSFICRFLSTVPPRKKMTNLISIFAAIKKKNNTCSGEKRGEKVAPWDVEHRCDDQVLQNDPAVTL